MITIDLFKKMYCFDLNVNFTIHQETLVIQGPSGAGKSTILDCIAGIKQADSGSITMKDRIIFSSEKQIYTKIRDRNIGYVFQNYALFPHMTVKNNIFFGLRCKKLHNFDYAEYIMEVLKIHHLKDRYPSKISGGEKQRVALARALVMKPDLLLLDEPFSALDQDTKEIVYKEFLQFKKIFNIAMILVTHNPYEASLLGDKIIHIQSGSIVQSA